MVSEETKMKMEDPRFSVVMTATIKPLNVDSDLTAMSTAWRLWKQKFLIYLEANTIDKESVSRQIAIFLSLIGDDCLEIFNSFGLDRKDASLTLEKVIQKFDNKFLPHKNITVERYNFFTRKQSSEESIEEYVTKLTNMAIRCDFENLKEQLICDMFVIGISNRKTQEKLLQQEALTIEKAIKIAKSIEISQRETEKLQMSNTKIDQESSVQAVKSYHQKEATNSSQRNQSTSPTRNNNHSRFQVSTQSQPPNQKSCNRCGQVHRFKCPAKGKTCSKCKKYNHFAQYCFSNKDTNTKNVSMISQSFQSQDNEEINQPSHYVINAVNKESNEWNITVKCYDHALVCRIDTGADTNVISKDTMNKIRYATGQKVNIFKTNNKVFSFSGQLIPNIGSCILKFNFENGLTANICFVVVNAQCQTILGWKICEKLGIVKRIFALSEETCHENQRSVNNIVNKYSSTFVGLGCLPTQAHIDVDSNVTPKVCPVRKIPFALHDRLKEELSNMEKLGVIEKVIKPTKWVNSIVLVEKPNGKLRLCLDPRNLNVAVKRPHYPYPTFDDLRSKIAGATIFSKFDANSGYWMIPLDSESSDLCTFNTPFGRYKFLRLPYGINSSGEIFHRTMSELFEGLPGVIVYIDDILVYGSNEKEHNQRLESVFKRAQEINLKFNKSKCQFGVKEVKYLGHIFNEKGVSPDMSKIEAITKISSPKNVKELQRFLGMVNYLGSFIPNLSTETNMLRDLLKKQNSWQWSPMHEQQFTKLKSIICHTPVLVHYDVKKQIRMSVDASKDTVGAVIFHDKNPIAYASKSLTQCQENYAQIEKELYAIVFGCKKFHQYVYGKPVYVETDHQPLVTLFKKPLSDVPTRLQRMMITLQAYHLIVTYTKGTEMYISDTLSRSKVNNIEVNEILEEIEDNIESHVNLLTSNLAITQEKLNKILINTNSDYTLQKLKEFYKSGWPSCKQNCDPKILPYWNIRHEIHVINDLIFKSNAIIIPTIMRPEILSILHASHMGIEKTKTLARGVVYWPNMNHEIEVLIKQCESCLTFSPNKTKEPLLPHDQPTLPWLKLATDLFEHNGKKYLIVVDFYSNYFEVAYLNQNTTHSTVITQLKSIFSRHGIPLQLVSDGGPPFNSINFKEFLSEWDIEHIVSSPHLSRSNGLAEATVKIVKNIFRKCDDSNTDPYLGLLQYRTTPRGNLKSPSQLLMSRQLRTKLPTQLSNLKPKVVKISEHNQQKQRNIQKTKRYYDKSSKPYPELNINDKIYFKKDPKGIIWSKGSVISKTKFPRSYIVKDEVGNSYRRSSQHIKLTHKKLSNSQSIPSQSHSHSDSHSHLNNAFHSNNTFHSQSGQNSSPQIKPKSQHMEKGKDDEIITYLIYKPLQPRSRSDSHSSISKLSDQSMNSFYESIQSDDMEIESPILVEVDTGQEIDSHDETLIGETSSSSDSKNSVISVHSSERPSPSTSYSNVQSETSPQELTENSPAQDVPLHDTPVYSSRGRLIKKKQPFDV